MMRSPAEIEKIKLTAGMLNALASGTILATIVAPYIGFGMGTLSPSTSTLQLFALSGFGCACGVVVHLIARRILDQMEA